MLADLSGDPRFDLEVAAPRSNERLVFALRQAGGVNAVIGTTGFSDEQDQIVALQDSLAETFLIDCYDLDTGLAEAQRQLDASGLTGWTVVNPEPFDRSRPCAGAGPDIDTQQVLVFGARSS